MNMLENCLRELIEKGDILRFVDGYYVFWPTACSGHYSPEHLRFIADKLDEMNKEWDEQVKKELECANHLKP